MSNDANAIADALKIPGGSPVARDLYAAAAQKLVGDTPGVQPSPFAALPKYPFEYHCQRFVMGNTMSMDSEGRKEFIPTDDDEKLAEVMQLKWEGKAIITNRLDTFLQDGTVVVWLEWVSEKAAPAKTRPDTARTVAELLDPRVPPASAGPVPEDARKPPTNSAQGSDDVDVLAAVAGASAALEAGPSYENDDDF